MTPLISITSTLGASTNFESLDSQARKEIATTTARIAMEWRIIFA